MFIGSREESHTGRRVLKAWRALFGSNISTNGSTICTDVVPEEDEVLYFLNSTTF